MASRVSTRQIRAQCLFDVDGPEVRQLAAVDVLTSLKDTPWGAGVIIHLNLPVEPDARVIGRLNRDEGLGLCGAHLLGSWVNNRPLNMLTFAQFIPNAALAPGLIGNLVATNASRARWAGQILRQ